MAQVLSLSRTFPPHSYPQERFTKEIADLLPMDEKERTRFESLHQKVEVGHRYVAVPLTEVANDLKTFTNKNDAFIPIGLDMVERGVRSALTKSGIRAEEVDHIFFVCFTALSNPSIDIRLLNRFKEVYDPSTALGPDVGCFRSSVARTSIFGVGCEGGGTLLNRATEYLSGHPKKVVVAIALELFTLTLQYDDTRIANLVTTGLFGDAAVSMVMCGDKFLENRRVAQAASLTRAAFSKLDPPQTRRSFDLEAPSSPTNSSDDHLFNPSVATPTTSISRPASRGPQISTVSPELKPTLRPRVVGSRAVVYPDTEDLIAWEVGSFGFKILLSNGVGDVIGANLLKDVTAFLEDTAASAPPNSRPLPTTVDGISSYLVHPGGPKLLRIAAKCLSVKSPESESSQPERQQSLKGFEVAWQSLWDYGNCSAVSVLMVLDDTMNTTAKVRPGKLEREANGEGKVMETTFVNPSSSTPTNTLNLQEGDYSLLIAFGPGFAIEMSLMEWVSV